MVLDARSLKHRYQPKWSRSNARELIVKAVLDVLLPDGFEARLTGLGAGEDGYIDRTYKGLLEAFDITIYYKNRPAAFVDVTGVPSPRDAKPKLGYCVGSWKIHKAKRHGVDIATWIAFVIDSEPTILWKHIKAFEKWGIRPERLYGDEREVLCLPRSKWKHYSDFERWLRLYAPSYANYIQALLEMDKEMEKLHSRGKDPASPDPF
ncbi:MAG: nuclease [Desulfurococcales archaeon]|nr:nuclease [Desulfurococcales archaeon]